MAKPKAQSFRRVKKLPEPKPIGRWRFTDACPHCHGTGRVKPLKREGWIIEYHYQDGHEQSQPMTKKEAVQRMIGGQHGYNNKTLIGPDGQIYTIPSG